MSGVLASWLPGIVLAAALVFWAVSIVDLARTDPRNVRTFPREVWAAIVVFGSVIGAVGWWTAGRPRQE
ncbi:PLDc N-terminal domain-containing protein [Sinomonas sp. JGH33]|uniref:PLDc N-terminal domain-containing protein n=1 Tax=Sinomonas terricola TaxID=3110330 RepID=A0ABU5TC27_9MICC|nr:PLDc N-terminal domain-containing protein [Sinomonas sp. JGH33]MEA5457210.1 PLDc N-terminal domain-containing protein [Sinomonas sp. JGH33]